MEYRCPGSSGFGTPTLMIKKCPQCGAEIELFSIDAKAQCYNCGFTAYNDTNACIFYCEHARECIGDEMYDRLVADREVPPE